MVLAEQGIPLQGSGKFSREAFYVCSGTPGSAETVLSDHYPLSCGVRTCFWYWFLSLCGLWVTFPLKKFKKSHDYSYQEVTVRFAPSIIASKYETHRFQTISQKRREKSSLCRFHWKCFIPSALKGSDAEPKNMFRSSWHQISLDLEKLAEFQITHISDLIKSRCRLKVKVINRK